MISKTVLPCTCISADCGPGFPRVQLIVAREALADLSRKITNEHCVLMHRDDYEELVGTLQRLFNCVPLSSEGPAPESKIVTSAGYWRTAFDAAKATLIKHHTP